MSPRPPPVPSFTAELVADPERLARALDQFARDVNSYARATDAEAARTVNTPEAIYTTAAGQSIPNATPTIVNFDTVVIDTDGVVTTGSAWRATLAPGTYVVESVVGVVTGTGVAYDIFFDLVVNGAIAVRGLRLNATTPALGGVVSPTIAQTIRIVDAGSAVDLRLYQNTGAARLLEAGHASNRISIRRVR